MKAAALAVGGVLALGGLRSAWAWAHTQFLADSTAARVLYAVHVGARVGMWFAFAGVLSGYALVAHPARFRWLVLVPIGLAAVQMLTALTLGRAPDTPVPEE